MFTCLANLVITFFSLTPYQMTGIPDRIHEWVNTDTVLHSDMIICSLYDTDTIYLTSNGGGDATTDVQSALDKAQNRVLKLMPGIYPIDLSRGLSVGSFTTVILTQGVHLVGYNASLQGSYQLLRLDEVERVRIFGGGHLQGDKYRHVGSAGEHGHLIRIQSSKHCSVEGLNLSSSWGDAIYIGGGSTPSNDIIISSVSITGARRNGISVTNCVSFKINDVIVSRSTGTKPCAGVDLEPNVGSIVRDGVVKNLRTYKCDGPGLGIYAPSLGLLNNIEVTHLRSAQCESGLDLNRAQNIQVRDCVITGSASQGLAIRGGGRKILIDKISIGLPNRGIVVSEGDYSEVQVNNLQITNSIREDLLLDRCSGFTISNSIFYSTNIVHSVYSITLVSSRLFLRNHSFVRRKDSHSPSRYLIASSGSQIIYRLSGSSQPIVKPNPDNDYYQYIKVPTVKYSLFLQDTTITY